MNVGSPVNALCFVDHGKSRGDGLRGTAMSGSGTSRRPPERPALSIPGRVFSIAVSPDGTTLAAAGDEGVIRLFHLPGGRPVASLKGHGSPVESLAFSPDGKVLASAGWDQTVRLWDGSSGKALAVLRGLKEQGLCVRFSPDGKLLAASGGQTSVPHDKPCPPGSRSGTPARTPSSAPSRPTRTASPPWHSRPTARPWPRAAWTRP